MGDLSTQHTVPAQRRVEFIDLLKGWAVIVMIETHVVNATLTASILESDAFQWVKFINGLVAPSFLFSSGMAYAVTTRRKIADYLAFGKPLFKQLGRLLLILFIAYMLHLPEFSYTKLAKGVTEKQWLVFLQADVLQCIAVSLLFVQCLLLVVKSEKRLYAVLASLGVIILLSTPIMWGIDFLGVVPAPVAAYLNGLHYSLFPLFPWSVFLFTGAVCGFHFMNARTDDARTALFMNKLFVAGILLFAGSFLLHPLASAAYPTYDYWRFSPSFVLLRIGIVMILLYGMFLYERRNTVSQNSVVTLLGRESLLVYTAHLLLIYGDFGTFNFRKVVDHTYGYTEALIATVVLLLLMYGLALCWSNIKKTSPRLKTAVNVGLVMTLLLVFLFGPGE